MQSLRHGVRGYVASAPELFRLAVIGSGPAGFYTAYKVMAKIREAHVDMYERLPVPYGLVRFGVAPDHPEVKNCQDKFEEVASSPRFTFIGNTSIGDSLPLEALIPHYDAVLFAYGASEDRQLGIPGEQHLGGIYSARAFVGWYNGLPEYAKLEPSLDEEEAVIIGQGNVALDVARILLTRVEELRKTDITDYALEKLAKSRVKSIRVVGRRGPMQASFTIKELRELMKLPDVAFKPIESSLLPADVNKLNRSSKRMMELLKKGSGTSSDTATRKWSLDFLLSPKRFKGKPLETGTQDSPVLHKIIFDKMKYYQSEPNARDAKVMATGEDMVITSSLAFRSIGYKSQLLPGMAEMGIPFNERLGIIPNDVHGRILRTSGDGSDYSGNPIPGLYGTGWVARGPNGVIANTMDNAFATADGIVSDWERGIKQIGGEELKEGWSGVKATEEGRKLLPVSWEDWKKIDLVEKQRGAKEGAERRKLTSVEEMLHLLD